MEANKFAGMSAEAILHVVCPAGDPVIDGVQVNQDWENGETQITFSDGSAVLVCGSHVLITTPLGDTE